MNTLRQLVERWNGIVVGIDSGENELTPRREGRAFGLQWCSSELSAELPKWERLVEVASVVEKRIGWRGFGYDDKEKFYCEFCGESHEDSSAVPHTESCPITELRAALKEVQ